MGLDSGCHRVSRQGGSASPDAASALRHMEPCYCRPAVLRQRKRVRQAKGLLSAQLLTPLVLFDDILPGEGAKTQKSSILLASIKMGRGGERYLERGNVRSEKDKNEKGIFVLQDNR